MFDRTDYEGLADEYARHRRPNPEVVARLLAAVAPASRVVEVGCGTGNYISAIWDAKRCSCLGIDPSPAMLARLAARQNGVEFAEGTAEHLPRNCAPADLVFSVDVIHHVGDRPAAFEEAFRILRPAGLICTVTDSAQVIRNRNPQSLYFPETIPIELERYPRIHELRAAMDTAGFTAIREETAQASYELTDSTAYRAKVFSSLHLIDDTAFERGLERMDARLRHGPLQCLSQYSLLWGTKPQGGPRTLAERHPSRP